MIKEEIPVSTEVEPRTCRKKFFDSLSSNLIYEIEKYFDWVKDRSAPLSLWRDVNIIYELYMKHYLEKVSWTKVIKALAVSLEMN